MEGMDESADVDWDMDEMPQESARRVAALKAKG